MTSDESHRRAHRKLSDEDRRAWNAVARSVRPLRRRAASAESEEADQPDPPHKPLHKPAAKGRVAAPAPKAAGPHSRPAGRRPAEPALAPLPRRERARLARGTIAIDARIDLHGLTQSEAHAALARFLRRAQADGARFALVITGKGARFADDGGGGAGERGVLRRQVPLWLRLPDMRAYVVGYEDADAVHGGAGALYVHLRRRQTS